MARQISKKGAMSVTKDIDRLASVVQENWADLGVSQKFAKAFAYNCDVLSDRIERKAGIARKADFDPAEIGAEKAGPLVQDADEGFMNKEFSQQEKRELREKVQSPSFGKIDPAPQTPQAGKQAAVQRSAERLLAASDGMTVIATKKAGTGFGAQAASMSRSLLSLRQSVIAGTASHRRVLAALQVVSEAEPFLTAFLKGKHASEKGKIERLAGMAAKILAKHANDQQAEDAKKEGEDEDEVAAAKKAYLNALSRQAKKSEEAAPEKEDAEDSDDADDDAEESEESEDKSEDDEGKTAHGYDLYA